MHPARRLVGFISAHVVRERDSCVLRAGEVFLLRLGVAAEDIYGIGTSE